MRAQRSLKGPSGAKRSIQSLNNDYVVEVSSRSGNTMEKTISHHNWDLQENKCWCTSSDIILG